MTESPEPALQFERAEFTTPAEATCASCQQPIRDAYYTVNGQVSCERCRWDAETARESGSRAGRVARATAYGAIAGVLGAALWYGVRALTGYEVGLIAIVVGVMVGRAVLAGTGGRGGRFYQVLAVALTYTSIVSSYVPMIVAGMGDDAAAVPERGAVVMVLFSVFVMAIALAAPFLGGFENIIGIVIIGIGLWEAWKTNRRTTLEVTGPHRLAVPAADVA